VTAGASPPGAGLPIPTHNAYDHGAYITAGLRARGTIWLGATIPAGATEMRFTRTRVPGEEVLEIDTLPAPAPPDWQSLLGLVPAGDENGSESRAL
jgi:hypothetical protein